MVAGKMEKFYEEVCLLEPAFHQGPDHHPSHKLIAAKIGKLGENIAVRRFARFKVGDTGETVAVTKGRQSLSRKANNSRGALRRPFFIYALAGI